MMTEAQHISCKNLTPRKLSKRVRNVIFRESEIQSFSAKETISLENPNLVSPNMDLDNDRSKDEDTKIPVQGGVGENNAAISVV